MTLKLTFLPMLLFFANVHPAGTNSCDVFEAEWKSTYAKRPEFQGFQLHRPAAPHCIHGDFFGDGTADYAFFLKAGDGKVKLAFIDRGPELKIHILGLEDDPFEMDNYRWAEVFEKVDPNEVLWSNYTGDFRELSEVPENERIYLSYDALYLHAAESCGGGFVFWKDGRFQWLQQE